MFINLGFTAAKAGTQGWGIKNSVLERNNAERNQNAKSLSKIIRTEGGLGMSEKIYCGKCRMLLYFGEEIKRRLYMRAIPSEEAVLGYYGNTCPRCGNSLSLDTVNIEVQRRKRYVA